MLKGFSPFVFTIYKNVLKPGLSFVYLQKKNQLFPRKKRRNQKVLHGWPAFRFECGEGAGDCNDDNECAGPLICGNNNCLVWVHCNFKKEGKWTELLLQTKMFYIFATWW